MSKTYYKSQQWLNPIDSPSTGSVVCYDGDVQYDDRPYRSIFLEVSDCHQKARLHKSHTDSIEDFVRKLILLRKEIGDFICRLKTTKMKQNVFLTDGTLFAKEFNRVVHGKRGDYVEFEKNQILLPLVSKVWKTT